MEVPSRNGRGDCCLYDVLATGSIQDNRSIVMAPSLHNLPKPFHFSGSSFHVNEDCSRVSRHSSEAAKRSVLKDSWTKVSCHLIR